MLRRAEGRVLFCDEEKGENGLYHPMLMGFWDATTYHPRLVFRGCYTKYLDKHVGVPICRRKKAKIDHLGVLFRG